MDAVAAPLHVVPAGTADALLAAATSHEAVLAAALDEELVLHALVEDGADLGPADLVGRLEAERGVQAGGVDGSESGTA